MGVAVRGVPYSRWRGRHARRHDVGSPLDLALVEPVLLHVLKLSIERLGNQLSRLSSYRILHALHSAHTLVYRLGLDVHLMARLGLIVAGSAVGLELDDVPQTGESPSRSKHFQLGHVNGFACPSGAT